MNHYDIPGREKQPIELMYLGLTEEEFDGYCIGNVIKYILRCKHKGGIDDLYKAREYIDYMIRAYNYEPLLGDEVEDDEEAWTCWVCQNNRNLDRVVTRIYKEMNKTTEEYCEENKETNDEYEEESYRRVNARGATSNILVECKKLDEIL